MNKEVFETEKKYLSEVKDKVINDIDLINKTIALEMPLLEEEKKNFHEEKGFLFSSASNNFDTFAELDSEFNRINDKIIDLHNKQVERVFLEKLINAPYFGRVDVFESSKNQKFENYIGLKSIPREHQGFYVIDWRTPIASLFYDNEKSLTINTSTGNYVYNLINKRQYKIENGELQYCFDSDIKIDDEILQEVLGRNTSEKMRNIVSSIQQEQNKVIRFNEFNDVYVLGVAGSGKTSIALHRIAYLLYKLSGRISSKDILILSPNNVFSDYISNVLPELNEENVSDSTIENLILRELGKSVRIETKQENVERVLLKPSSSHKIFDKHTFEYLKNLLDFIQEYFANNFTAKDIKIDKIHITAEEIESVIKSKQKLNTLTSLITATADEFLKKYFPRIINVQNVREKVVRILKNELYSMFGEYNPYKVYKLFLHKQGLTFTTINNKIKNEDAYPILLIKFWVFGSYGYHYKHLVVDEVQDYTAVQLFLINWLFRCPKTVLGDTSQSVNSLVSKDVVSNIKNINKIFKDLILNEKSNEDLNLIKLNRSYRNSYEITKLANSIIELTDVELIMRESGKPKLSKVESQEQLNSVVVDYYYAMISKKYKNIAILTKTNGQAQRLYNILKDKLPINIINDNTKKFINGLNIMSVYQSKGLEFDAVLIYNVNDKHYNTEFDKHILYIATTRALHDELIVYSSEPSRFIKKYFELD